MPAPRASRRGGARCRRHKITIARQVVRGYKASDDLWPTEWIPKKLDAAHAKFADFIEMEVGNL